MGGPAGAALRDFLTGGGLGKASSSESLSDSGSVDLNLVAALEDLVDLVALHHSEQKLNAPQAFKQVSVLCVHMGVEHARCMCASPRTETNFLGVHGRAWARMGAHGWFQSCYRKR